MTEQQFAEWIDYHSDAFPGLSDWFGRNQGTVDHWQRAMLDVDLTAAKEATDLMLAGDIDQPRGYSEHVRVIRKNAREIAFMNDQRDRPKPVDGQPTFFCPLCKDRGTVVVLYPESIAAILDWLDKPFDVRNQPPARKTCAVACSCETGTEFLSRCSRKLPMYEERRHFRCESQYPAYQDVSDWAEDRNDWKA